MALLPIAASALGSPAVRSTFSCAVKFGSTPAALLIPLAGPTGTVGSGGAVGFQYQFQVVNYASSQYGHTVYLPTAAVLFPTTTGAFQSYDLKHAITITGSSWTNPASSSAWHKLSSSVTFRNGSTPELSTQKLAVMANDGFGTLELAFRWHWVVQSPGGSVTNGPWSVPNSTAFHPSIFYPAPFVDVVNHTPSPVTLGTNYTADLGGFTSSEPFFLELEFAKTGNVVMTHGATAPSGNSSPFAATILFNNRLGDLQPAPMLVHVHNHCGSLLASIPGTGAYAANATVTLATSVAACPTITLQGVHYSAGAHLTVTPSHTSIPITVPSCAGHTFSKWTATPDLRIVTATHPSTSVIVTYTGTLEATYA